MTALVALGDWVLRQALRDASQWPQPMKVAVNLSVSQLAQANLADAVERVLEEEVLKRMV